MNAIYTFFKGTGCPIETVQDCFCNLGIKAHVLLEKILYFLKMCPIFVGSVMAKR